MFDIGFWELLMIAVVSLVVIGPEKLPGVARSAGKWVGRARRFITDVKADIDREIKQEELRKALERDAGLDEIKQIMNTDAFTLEEEEKNPDYQVKAMPDEEQNEEQNEELKSNQSGHGEFEPLPRDEEATPQSQTVSSDERKQ